MANNQYTKEETFTDEKGNSARIAVYRGAGNSICFTGSKHVWTLQEAKILVLLLQKTFTEMSDSSSSKSGDHD